MNHDKKVIDWLLENENPAVKYRTLTEILGAKIEDEIPLYNTVWQSKPAIQMLRKQDENGLWENERKYYGMFTSLRYLTVFAELGLQKDERLDRAVNRAMEEIDSCGGDIAGCAAPLLLRAIVMLGYHERDDVRSAIDKFSSCQLKDGGFMCKRLLDKKPERKSCYKAALASLLMYSECKRKGFLPNGAEKLVEYFTKRDVFYSSDKTRLLAEGRFGWRFIDNFFPVEPMRMGLPLIMAALSVLGAGNDPALNAAWEMLEAKKDDNGRQNLEGTLTKQPISFGKTGVENKWTTFYAVLAEKYK